MQENFLFRELRNNKALYVSALLICLTAIFFMPRHGHNWDTHCWGLWSELMAKKGMAAAYDEGSPVNYLPLYLYVLKVYSFLTTPERLFENVYLLKYFTFIFDMAGMLLLVRAFVTPARRTVFFLAGLLNPAYLYNTLIWNQVDSIPAFFVFASFIFAWKDRKVISAAMFMLALNFKLQAVIFLPLLGLLWLNGFRWRVTLQALGLMILMQILIIMPWLLHGNAYRIAGVITSSVDYYPSVSMNAYNLWHLVFDGDLMFRKDTEKILWGVMNCKQAGLLLFFLFSAGILFRPAWYIIRSLPNGIRVNLNERNMLSVMALIGLFFFWFNTQMHERYIHPVLLFTAALAFRYRSIVPYVLISIACFFSLDSICRHTGIEHIMPFMYRPETIAIIYGISMMILLTGLFRARDQKGDL